MADLLQRGRSLTSRPRSRTAHRCAAPGVMRSALVGDLATRPCGVSHDQICSARVPRGIFQVRAGGRLSGTAPCSFVPLRNGFIVVIEPPVIGVQVFVSRGDCRHSRCVSVRCTTAVGARSPVIDRIVSTWGKRRLHDPAAWSAPGALYRREAGACARSCRCRIRMARRCPIREVGCVDLRHNGRDRRLRVIALPVAQGL